MNFKERSRETWAPAGRDERRGGGWSWLRGYGGWGLLLAMTTVSLVAASDPRPLVIAHRGASGYLPEHTLTAKAYAHALGADYLEQDLVLSKDNVPVVLHDIHVDAVTDVAERFPGRARSDGRYYALDFTVAELKQLLVRERFHPASGAPVYPRRYPSARSPGAFAIPTLEEELELVAGLNATTGRRAGIYPELKQPAWHRAQGRDLSAAVLPILARFGYRTKDDPCFLQCFELSEVRRLRGELGWRGRLVMLIGGSAREADGTDNSFLVSEEGLRELAAVVDGIGPSLSRVVTWRPDGTRQVSDLVRLAHARGLVVHPYTVRRDELPRNCPSLDELHRALFSTGAAGADGVFTDFPDLTAAWIAAHRGTPQ